MCLLSFPCGRVPKGWVYGRRLVFVSVRTNKRQHHQRRGPLSVTTTLRDFFPLCLLFGSVQGFSFGGFLYVEGSYVVSVLSAYSSLCGGLLFAFVSVFFLCIWRARLTSFCYQMVSPFRHHIRQRYPIVYLCVYVLSDISHGGQP